MTKSIIPKDAKIHLMLLLGLGVLLTVIIGVSVFVFLGDQPAPEVDLTTAVAQIGDDADTGADTDSTTTDTTETQTEDPPSTETPTADSDDDGVDDDGVKDDDADDDPGQAPVDIVGVWTLQAADSDTDLSGEPSVSFAGFRVDEVLAGGIGEFTAVGRTADVGGRLELTDTALIATEVTVDFITLRTDNSNRDHQVQRALNTAEFPSAIFSLTEPVELSDHSSFTGSAVGDLTIKGITNRAEFDLEAQLVEDTLVVVGSSPVVFADYDVQVPSVPIVISAEDHGIIEFQLFFTR